MLNTILIHPSYQAVKLLIPIPELLFPRNSIFCHLLICIFHMLVSLFQSLNGHTGCCLISQRHNQTFLGLYKLKQF